MSRSKRLQDHYYRAYQTAMKEALTYRRDRQDRLAVLGIGLGAFFLGICVGMTPYLVGMLMG